MVATLIAIDSTADGGFIATSTVSDLALLAQQILK